MGNITYIAFVLAGLCLQGATLSSLWGWFVVPIFEAPSFTPWQGVGLTLVYSVISYKVRERPAGEDESVPWYVCLQMIFIPLILLLLGALIHGHIS